MVHTWGARSRLLERCCTKHNLVQKLILSLLFHYPPALLFLLLIIAYGKGPTNRTVDTAVQLLRGRSTRWPDPSPQTVAAIVGLSLVSTTPFSRQVSPRNPGKMPRKCCGCRFCRFLRDPLYDPGVLSGVFLSLRICRSSCANGRAVECFLQFRSRFDVRSGVAFDLQSSISEKNSDIGVARTRAPPFA